MKLDRRAFVKLIAGGVGGTLLSPLPWKLADDTAIWSQNWSWRPSPARGEPTVVDTLCTLCPGGCGVRVRLIDGRRAVTVERGGYSPANRGGMCALGAAGLQYLYGPSRIETPLKQTGKRGDPRTLKPITWDEALDLLAAKLQELRAEPQGLVCISGRRRGTVVDLLARFLEAFGSPNLLYMPAAEDAEELGIYLTQGRRTPAGYDLENSKLVLSFGSSLLEGWGAAARMAAVFGSWRGPTNLDRTRVIQVEPRCSLTASKADVWVAINPGTEAALAMGLAHVIVRDQLYDRAFMQQYTLGFEDWTDSRGRRRRGFKRLVLEDYKPEKVAAITGVPVPRIESLAKEFARTKPAVAVSGRGQGRMPGALADFLAVQALNALVGSWHRRGGVTFCPQPPLAPWAEVEPDLAAKRGLEAGRVDGGGGREFPAPANLANNYARNLAAGKPYPTKMLWAFEANPVHDLADAGLFRQGLERVDTLVAFTAFMDETAMAADLVLPVPTWLERLEDVATPPGLQYAFLGLARPVLSPRFEVRHPGEVLIQLAQKLGGAIGANMPWEDYESALKERLEGLVTAGSGRVADEEGLEPWANLGKKVEPNYDSVDDLVEKLTEFGCWYDTSTAMPSLGAAFATASGKFEFACRQLEKLGVVGADEVYLPRYQEIPAPGEPESYPLLLVPYESAVINAGPAANPPFLTKLLFDFELKHNDMFVQLNPETAAKLGLREGSKITLTTVRGKVRARVHLTAAARPGVVFMPLGLGHTGFDPYIKGKGANANDILALQLDPVSGLGGWWGTRVQISKA